MSLEPAPQRPCVVHLVRAANGPEPFSAFLKAWRSHAAGVECDLVFAMKGFASKDDGERLLEQAGDMPAQRLWFTDDGLDLDVYLGAAQQLGRDRYCFLNSFSEPLVDGWLAKLDEHIRRPDVGLAGATGSWGSNRSWMLFCLRLPNGYGGAFDDFPDSRKAFGQIKDLDPSLPRQSRFEQWRKRWGVRAIAVRDLPGQLLSFSGFPNHHLRTNAFAVKRSTLEQLELRPPQGHKRRAYRLESGHDSITRQVERLGLRTVVVDSDGRAYERDEWGRSETFWQGAQPGLLVADNQTRTFEALPAEQRFVLSRFAWGRDGDGIPS